MFREYYLDLHIHIGRTKTGAPVKIAAAPSLTLKNIIEFARTKKGIDIVGVIDCHVPAVLAEVEEAIRANEAYEMEGGGIRFHDVTLFLGSEIEINDEACQGPIHVLAYFATLEQMKCFSAWLKERMKNITLSSQRLYETGKNVQKKVRELDGLFIPAHVFTPFKSLYGKGVEKSLTEIFDPTLIDAIELGLSCDTMMADHVSELHDFPFLSNSDAHSLEKIAREYQIVRMKKPSFNEFRLALKERDGRKIVSNYGLHPRLGKYYETICEDCKRPVSEPICPHCNSEKQIKGVSKRIEELSSRKKSKRNRPPYYHQIPLEFIPKLGKKTLEKLRAQFGTDMNIIHDTSEEKLATVVSPDIAKAIVSARTGEVMIEAGGGGRYGKLSY